MTKDEAKALAKKGIEVSKKYSIPLKPKKKKQLNESQILYELGHCPRLFLYGKLKRYF